MAATTDTATTGDLLINGVEVGASLASDDVLSSASAGGSAIAKAAAINRVSAQSGVVATVGATTKYGSTQTTASQLAASGNIVVNGVTSATVYVTTDAAVSRQAVVRAINAISSQTGVEAIDTNDDNHGVVLRAADGRNVDVSLTTLTAGNTGLATGTTVGTIDLNSTTSSSIQLDSKVGGNIGYYGFKVGTYSADNSFAVTKARQVATTAATIASTTGLLNGSALIVNDITIDAAVAGDDTASVDSSVLATSSKAASAIAIAAAINKKSSLTGVTANAMANVVQGDGTYSNALTATAVSVSINGVSIGSVSNLTTRDSVMGLINAKTGQTGVTAVAQGLGLKLVAADGRNINIGSNVTAATAAGTTAQVASALGLTNISVGSNLTGATTYYASVSLKSDRAFNLRNGSESDSNANFALLGFATGTFGGTNAGLKIDKVDASTIARASSAITAIDAAITNVASMQSVAGAYQNRLEAIVSNLNESNQNMSAARSRLLDTDYATETTNLAKAQIIQQAATAMLAQANQSSQTVLALLK